MYIRETLLKVLVIWALAVLTSLGGTAAPSLFESQTASPPRGKIDELVFGRLERLGIQPANVCSDAVFVRRAYLDVIGTLPTALEAREFLLSRDPNKRRALIDRLLER